MTLAILCLGAFKSEKYGGFIPDFGSKEAPEFESIRKTALGSLIHRYGNPFILGSFGLARDVSLSEQFGEMRAEVTGK